MIIFLPAIVCALVLYAWGPERALRFVCLPVLLCVPTYFWWKTANVPAIDFGISALLPLGVVLIATRLGQWRFTRVDLWIAVYVFTCAYADFRTGEVSLAKYRLFYALTNVVIMYMAGKLLIEQSHARMVTVRTIVGLLCFTCVVGIPEYFLRMNLFLRAWIRFFPGEWPGWTTQLRWGFARVAGPFGTAEVFGMVLIMGLLFAWWLMPWNAGQPVYRALPWFSVGGATRALLALFAVTLFMTQSRGPMLGLVVAVPIAAIGRSKRPVRTACIVALVMLAVGIPGYLAAKQYSSGKRTDYGSDRETAQYRRQLLDNYVPLAEKGGAWGYGTFHPILGGQESIDDEFLRVYLGQGYVGLLALVLMVLDTGYALLRGGFAASSAWNRQFSFTMLGVLAGWTLTLLTVFLGAQSYELFFLLIGWAQMVGVRDVVPRLAPSAAPVTTAGAGSRAMTRIYT